MAGRGHRAPPSNRPHPPRSRVCVGYRRCVDVRRLTTHSFETAIRAELTLFAFFSLSLLLLARLPPSPTDHSVPLLGVFVANSTGNLLLLGMAAAGLRPRFPELVNGGKSGVAIGTYFLAAYIVGRLGRAVGERRRAWVMGWFGSSFLTPLPSRSERLLDDSPLRRLRGIPSIPHCYPPLHRHDTNVGQERLCCNFLALLGSFCSFPPTRP